MRLFRDWEVKKTLGSGSFGTVYEVENTDPLRVGERAAIKKIVIPKDENEIEVLRSDAYDDASITQTFQERLRDIVNEYRIMQQISGHTNIVNCRDIGYIQHDNGIGWDIYIVMELLTPLRKLPTERFTEEEIVRLGSDICKALSVCAKRGIIHRDVKPDNIFVSEYGDYKLGDFGISRVMEGTRASTIGIGTYDYMAPEVLRESYDRTADLYSLGMVLYWLLNERRTPFLKLPPAVPTVSEKELARKRRFNGDLLPPPAHGSEELKRIVLKACAFDPKDRYQSAEKMLRDLEALSGKGSAPAPSVTPSVAPEPKQDAPTDAVENEAKRPILPVTQSEEHDEDGAETVGLFGGVTPRQSAPQPERQDDDNTVGLFGGGVKQPDIETGSKMLEEVSAEDEEQTVSAFKPEKEPHSPQPTPQPKPVSKPKRRLWPMLVGLGIVVVLLFVLICTRMFSRPVVAAPPTEAPAQIETPAEIPVQTATPTETVTKNGITYSLDGDTLTVSGLEGVVNPAEAFPNWETAKQRVRYVEIKNGVTGIGSRAFVQCRQLTSVSIPNSVVSIGTSAFSDCSSLTKMTIPDSVTSIGDYSFCRCSKLTSVSIPNGVTSIESCTFYGCNSLTSVSIPASVTSIGNSAFYGCSSLTNVKIPDSVTSIGNSAFYDCSSLTNVKIPDSVTSIGNSAFYYCSSLTSVSIPASVTSIGYSAFYDCRSLTNVSIPASVTSIGEWAFSGCSSLNHIYYGGTEAQWNAIAVGVGNDPLFSATLHYYNSFFT